MFTENDSYCFNFFFLLWMEKCRSNSWGFIITLLRFQFLREKSAVCRCCDIVGVISSHKCTLIIHTCNKLCLVVVLLWHHCSLMPLTHDFNLTLVFIWCRHISMAVSKKKKKVPVALRQNFYCTIQPRLHFFKRWNWISFFLLVLLPNFACSCWCLVGYSLR